MSYSQKKNYHLCFFLVLSATFSFLMAMGLALNPHLASGQHTAQRFNTQLSPPKNLPLLNELAALKPSFAVKDPSQKPSLQHADKACQQDTGETESENKKEEHKVHCLGACQAPTIYSPIWLHLYSEYTFLLPKPALLSKLSRAPPRSAHV